MSSNNIKTSTDYRQWLTALKSKFRHVQLKAAARVNRSLLEFYWQLGQEIIEKQAHFAWGDGFLNQLAADLAHDFPEVKGFSPRNLKYIRQWFVYWSNNPIGQQPVAQLLNLPWGHNLLLIAKCKTHSEALYYAQNAIEHGWSRSVLTHQIESGLWQREGQAVSNTTQPISVAEWETQLTRCLPEELRTSLPSIDVIEKELGDSRIVGRLGYEF